MALSGLNSRTTTLVGVLGGGRQHCCVRRVGRGIGKAAQRPKKSPAEAGPPAARRAVANKTPPGNGGVLQTAPLGQRGALGGSGCRPNAL
jgi:hypothetical protein